MKDLSIVIKEMKVDSLISSTLSYMDDLPQSAVEMPEGCSPEKLLMMKYYDGSITEQEHQVGILRGKDFNPYMIYDLIFRMRRAQRMPSEEEVDERWIQEALELYWGLENTSGYKIFFERLLVSLFSITENDILRTIALRAYMEDSVVRGYVAGRDVNVQNLFLLRRPEDGQYNKYYGVTELPIENREDVSLKEDKNKKNDWFTMKFGGA